MVPYLTIFIKSGIITIKMFAQKDEVIAVTKASILIENKHSRIVYSVNLKRHIVQVTPRWRSAVDEGSDFPVSFLPDAKMLVAECRCLISLRVSRFVGNDYVKRI